MKTTIKSISLAFLLLFLTSLFIPSCKKEPILKIGQYYRIKGGVFNKGKFQPSNPVLLDTLYIDTKSQSVFAACRASVNWNEYNQSVKGIVPGNISLLDKVKFLNQSADTTKFIKVGDTTKIEWAIPQADLTN